MDVVVVGVGGGEEGDGAEAECAAAAASAAAMASAASAAAVAARGRRHGGGVLPRKSRRSKQYRAGRVRQGGDPAKWSVEGNEFGKAEIRQICLRRVKSSAWQRSGKVVCGGRRVRQGGDPAKPRQQGASPVKRAGFRVPLD